MLAEYRHLRTFGHWPKWFALAPGMPGCERCLKPPSRPRRWWQPLFIPDRPLPVGR